MNKTKEFKEASKKMGSELQKASNATRKISEEIDDSLKSFITRWSSSLEEMEDNQLNYLSYQWGNLFCGLRSQSDFMAERLKKKN